MAEERRKLNWREACQIMGCGKSYFYRLVRKGVLRAWHLEGARRGMWVYEDDCRALVKKRNGDGA